MIEASAHANGDDVFLAWRMPVMPDCWGVAIYREVYRDGAVVSFGYLDNRVGFAAQKPKPGEARPSTEWPFQRYTWTDHGVGEGDEVAYWISPVFERDGWLVTDEDQAAVAGPVAVTASAGSTSAYFNRGLVLSQFMLRHLPDGWAELPATPKRKALVDLKASLAADSSDLRRFLMGDLGGALFGWLAREEAAGSEVHAALYELSDASLIAALGRFGARAHLVLSNGSTQNSRTPRTPKPYDDGNAEAADALDGVVDLRRRMFFSSQGLGHNKFVVISRAGTPAAVWTGSTNWATTGLCTQANNGVLIDDERVAAAYLAQWKRLAADNALVADRGVEAPAFGPALVAGNDTVHASTTAGIRTRVWFTRTSTGAELAEVVDLIEGAERSVFFLLFEPGTSSPVVAALNAIVDARSDVVVHGVINTIRQQKADAPEGGTEVEVGLVAPDKRRGFRLRIVQPEGVESDLSSWATEVTRQDFLMPGGAIGHAIVHSKAIVIDPFTKPVVVTGSHNFSARASSKNDENLLIRHGDGALAERFAVHIMGVYQHYRWRQFLHDTRRAGRKPFEHLTTGDGWQSKLTDARQRELSVWL